MNYGPIRNEATTPSKVTDQYSLTRLDLTSIIHNAQPEKRARRVPQKYNPMFRIQIFTIQECA